MMPVNRDRSLLFASVCLALAAVSALAVAGVRRFAEAAVREKTMPTYVSAKTESSGTEIVMMVVGSSQCGASTNQLLPGMLERARAALSRSSEKDAKLFATVGVAIDWSIADGLAFLHATGPYSEVVVGRNWLNSAAVSYLWRDHSGRAALPQIILIEREVAIDDANIRISPDRVLTRIVGLDSIGLWVARGAPSHAAEDNQGHLIAPSH